MRYWFAFAFLFVLARIGSGCPFCSALAPCLREELSQVDHVAIAICTESARQAGDLPLHSFRIESLAPGAAEAKQIDTSLKLVGTVVQAYSLKRYKPGERTLMFCIGQDGELAWSPVEPMSKPCLEYVQHVFGYSRLESPEWLARHGAASIREEVLASSRDKYRWLNLYWKHLESEDTWVRRDSYNALAKVSTDELRPWTKELGPKAIRERLEQKEVSVSHRRFYWAILGLCGKKEDAKFAWAAIERQMTARKEKPISQDAVGLDAAISTYLLLGGEPALEKVEAKLLGGEKRHSSERFAALSALRVHAQEFQAFDKKRICKALSSLLDDADCVDMVIPDLARLEDWSHVEALKTKFLAAAESEQQQLLVPIINYLRACPKPEAAKALDACENAAPDAFKRAKTIFPFLRDSTSDL